MNLKEGMRRLALLVGIIGAILGGIVSYAQLSEVVHQMRHHKAFERLSNSGTVMQARRDWIGARIPLEHYDLARKLGGTATIPMIDPQGKVRHVPINDTDAAKASGDERVILFTAPDRSRRWVPESEKNAAIKAGGVPFARDYSDQQKLLASMWLSFDAKRRAEMLAAMNAEQKAALRALIETEKGSNDWFTQNAPVPPSTVNNEGIAVIHWTRDLTANSIETKAGQILYPSPEPSIWIFILFALLPVFGFILPWAAIRAIFWVGDGFATRV